MAIYLDGVNINDNAMMVADHASVISFPLNTHSVIAIYTRNTGGPKGIMASTTTGLVSDGSWRCSDKWVAGWMNPDFDDTVWPWAKIMEHDQSSM